MTLNLIVSIMAVSLFAFFMIRLIMTFIEEFKDETKKKKSDIN